MVLMFNDEKRQNDFTNMKLKCILFIYLENLVLSILKIDFHGKKH